MLFYPTFCQLCQQLEKCDFRYPRYPRMGLSDARDGAKEALRLVSEGKNPTADRVTLARLKRLPAPDGGREFATVLDRFIASQRTKGRRSTDKVKALLDKDATAFWQHRQIDSITAADVVERIEAIVQSRLARGRIAVSGLGVQAVQLRGEGPAMSRQSGTAHRDPR